MAPGRRRLSGRLRKGFGLAISATPTQPVKVTLAQPSVLLGRFSVSILTTKRMTNLLVTSVRTKECWLSCLRPARLDVPTQVP